MLCRNRIDMLVIVKHTNVPTALHDMEHQEHGRNCRVHVIEVGFCTEVAYAQKYKEKYEQHRILLEHLRNARYADVQLHLFIRPNA